jgi:hypothetical protein
MGLGRIGRLALPILLLLTGTARAETTSGGVTWLDTLGYTKPAFYPITVPDEASTANKYYVNLSAGSGTTCSQASPCGSFASVAGKTGMTGGPAYVYVKGTGTAGVMPTANFFGSAGNEIVIKPWPSDATATTITANAGCNVGNAVTLTGSGVHHVVIDGGPSGLITFAGSGCSGNQNGYTFVENANDMVIYRVRIDANNSGGPAVGIGAGASPSNIKFINVEVYDAGSYYGFYTGGGSSCPGGTSSHQNVEIRNSIIRDVDGRGIQVEPRGASSGFVIDGNAFHNIGYNNSGSSSISCAVQPADACGVTTGNLTISNNIGWDLGGGFACLFQSSATLVVRNNTAWDYGNKTPASLNSHGITSFTDGNAAVVQNNIVLAPAQGGINPMNRNSGWTSAKNLCESGSSCAATSVAGTAATTFTSTLTSSVDFLKPATGGPAANAGNNYQANGITTDYLGASRPGSGSFEIGAMEVAAAGGSATGAATYTEAADAVSIATSMLTHGAAAGTDANDALSSASAMETHGAVATSDAADSVSAAGIGQATCAGTIWTITLTDGTHRASHISGGQWVPCTGGPTPTLMCTLANGQIWTFVNGGATTQMQRRNKQWFACP